MRASLVQKQPLPDVRSAQRSAYDQAKSLSGDGHPACTPVWPCLLYPAISLRLCGRSIRQQGNFSTGRRNYLEPTAKTIWTDQFQATCTDHRQVLRTGLAATSHQPGEATFAPTSERNLAPTAGGPDKARPTIAPTRRSNLAPTSVRPFGPISVRRLAPTTVRSFAPTGEGTSHRPRSNLAPTRRSNLANQAKLLRTDQRRKPIRRTSVCAHAAPATRERHGR